MFTTHLVERRPLRTPNLTVDVYDARCPECGAFAEDVAGHLVCPTRGCATLVVALAGAWSPTPHPEDR